MKLLKGIFKMIIALVIIAMIALSVYLFKEYKVVEAEIQKGVIETEVKKLRAKESYSKLADVDKKYINAVIAAEDHRFYNHGAVDFKSILRAIDTNIRNRQLIEGGSTITQQLVKNTFFSQKQTPSRKIKELFMSIEMEKRFSKDEILELYINNSYFGSGYYSIKEATNGYFGKDPKELSIAESAFLAGVPNAPSVYNPRINKELAIQRRRQVLEKMLTYKYINSEEAKEAIESELEVKK